MSDWLQELTAFVRTLTARPSDLRKMGRPRADRRAAPRRAQSNVSTQPLRDGVEVCSFMGGGAPGRCSARTQCTMVKVEVADFDRPCVAPPEPVFGRQTEGLAMELYARARNIQTNPEFDRDLRKTFEIYTVDRAN